MLLWVVAYTLIRGEPDLYNIRRFFPGENFYIHEYRKEKYHDVHVHVTTRLCAWLSRPGSKVVALIVTQEPR